MNYDFKIIFTKFPILLPALVETLKITVVSIIFGFFLGVLVSMLRLSKHKILRLPARSYIAIIRGTPILLQLSIIYFGMTGVVRLDAFPAAVLAFGIHLSAYIAEIFRGAVLSIDSGQNEAAISLGMTKLQSFRRVVFPQAFKRAIPPLGNQFIIATKDSSLASVIGINELLAKSEQLGSSTYRQLEFYIIAGIYYLIVTLVLSFLINQIEKKLSISSKGGTYND